jgi:hypothetical protein
LLLNNFSGTSGSNGGSTAVAAGASVNVTNYIALISGSTVLQRGFIAGETIILQIYDTTSLTVLAVTAFTAGANQNSLFRQPLTVSYNGPLTPGDVIVMQVLNVTSTTTAFIFPVATNFYGYQTS